MMKPLPRAILVALLILAPGLAAQSPAPQAEGPRYLLPPQRIIDAFDAQPIPTAMLSPSRTVIALITRKANPTITELARPMLRLAGHRIDPRNNGPYRTPGIYAITLKKLSDATSVNVTVPDRANLTNVQFSPDGSHLSFIHIGDKGVELWVADTATGRAKAMTGNDRLNAAAGDPCHWMNDGSALVCQVVPNGRGPVPIESPVPTGPNVQENNGKAAPSPTFEDVLKTSFDDALFDYYFTSQVATFDSTTGRKTAIGHPAIFESVSPSPDSNFLIVTRVKRPFSHLMPMNAFSESVEVWSRRGEVVHLIADAPSHEGLVTGGVITGPRGAHWRSDQPATIVWAEALDEGNPKNRVPFRDRILSLSAPFTAAPTELAKTEYRFSTVSFTDKGIALLSEADRPTRRTRTWVIEPGASPRQLWDRKQEARYDDPGTPVTRRDGSIVQNGDAIYLSGLGASPEGDRPFLDRLDLKTKTTERLFRSEPRTYETVVAPLGDDGGSILTRFETPSDPPNYVVRNLKDGTKRAITAFADPQPQLRGATHEIVSYARKDGVKLSGTLYLPPGYKKGERLPLIVWAYPREFTDVDSAGEVSGSPYRFTIVTGASHLFLLLDGYAVLDDATMPIVGPGETANDTYVEQLVGNAEAAIDKVVDMGVADRGRIGVGGHSYGAFMTANLLAHSRLFKAGFAESGAYNRSLTPFGFQNERRTFWDVPDLYAKLSPFWYANQVKDPILLTHGEADDNSGTFPIQSERFYMALKGFGATVRYITLPNEAHGYAARETLLDVIAEKVTWFGKYVKGAESTTTTESRR